MTHIIHLMAHKLDKRHMASTLKTDPTLRKIRTILKCAIVQTYQHKFKVCDMAGTNYQEAIYVK